MKTRIYMAIAFCAIFAGCGGGGGSAPPPILNGGTGESASPSPTPSPTPAALRAYISDNGTPGTVSVFSLPLTSSSAPRISIAGSGGPAAMGFDPVHRLFVVNSGSGVIQVFSQPITNAAVPTVAFHGPNTGIAGNGQEDVAFDPSGNAYISIGACAAFRCVGNISAFAAPITSSSVPAFVISERNSVPGLAFDATGNLWAVASGFGGYATSITQFKPPFSSTSTPSLSFGDRFATAIAFDSTGNLYAANLNGVDVYTPPLTSSTAKAFTIAAPGASPAYLAFDSAGTLYVTVSNGTVLVFTPPFSSNSTPAVTMPIPGAPTNAGIAIGP